MDAFSDEATRVSEETTRRLEELAGEFESILPSGGLANAMREQQAGNMPLDTVEAQKPSITDAKGGSPSRRVGALPSSATRLESATSSSSRLENALQERGSAAAQLQSVLEANGAQSGRTQNAQGRPHLRREGSVPAPTGPPPPAPAHPQETNETGNPTDSLSLMQLRRLVHDMPKVEPTPYAFTYQDAASLPEELEEWFDYSLRDKANIQRAEMAFDAEWRALNNENASGELPAHLRWQNTSVEKRRGYMQELLAGLNEEHLNKRLRYLEVLVFIMLGCWKSTAGLESTIFSKVASTTNVPGTQKPKHQALGDSPQLSVSPEAQREKSIEAMYKYSGLQLEWLRTNAFMLFEIKGLQAIFDLVRSSCLREW
jgi:hypothetical protein